MTVIEGRCGFPLAQVAGAVLVAAGDAVRVETFQQRHGDAASGAERLAGLAHGQRWRQSGQDRRHACRGVGGEHDVVTEPHQLSGSFGRPELAGSEPERGGVVRLGVGCRAASNSAARPGSRPYSSLSTTHSPTRTPRGAQPSTRVRDTVPAQVSPRRLRR